MLSYVVEVVGEAVKEVVAANKLKIVMVRLLVCFTIEKMKLYQQPPC